MTALEASVGRYASSVLVNEVTLEGCVRCAHLKRLLFTAFYVVHLHGEREPASPSRAGVARDLHLHRTCARGALVLHFVSAYLN